MSDITRRTVLGAVAAASTVRASSGKPALLGGPKVRTVKWPAWPVYDRQEEEALLGVLRSGLWNRRSGKQVARFEEAYAKLTGAKYCLATSSGTSALITSLSALGVGAGDEVIVPPYTFVATVNAVLMQHAIPVFVDTDRETFQMDAGKLEAAITERTAAIMPVHLGGSAADLDAIMAIAAKRKIPVIEDACQAHLAEWRNRRVGTWGATGCFSFQASKNLNCGDGGAILTNDQELADKCYAFHTNSSGRQAAGFSSQYLQRGANLRMTEFQGALLAAQMTRLESQTRRRQQNAEYLTSIIKSTPGIAAAKMYAGCNSNAYHLYMFRYDKSKFANLPLARFLKALHAEGIPASAGYSPLNKEPFLLNTLNSRCYRRFLSEKQVNHWREKSSCPENDRLCEEAVWLTQNVLLADRSDMDQIAEAIRKIQSQAAELKES
jgi:dTDP-4-amino-4,6-dideoxygalactose transaminase